MDAGASDSVNKLTNDGFYSHRKYEVEGRDRSKFSFQIITKIKLRQGHVSTTTLFQDSLWRYLKLLGAYYSLNML